MLLVLSAAVEKMTIRWIKPTPQVSEVARGHCFTIIYISVTDSILEPTPS